MKKILTALYVMNLISCVPIQRPISTQMPKNNKDYKIEYLFEHDGCKVYRFNDEGRIVYFTNCRGETSVVTDTTVINNATNLKKQ